MTKLGRRVVIAADHAGYAAKEAVKKAVAEAGLVVADLGTDSDEPVDYPPIARRLAEAVACGEAEWGILLCGSGIGVAIAANRVPRVRAAVCRDAEEARLARAHNDANVLVLPARTLDDAARAEVVETFRTTPFEGGRHARRVAQLDEGLSGPRPGAGSPPGLVVPDHPLVADRLATMRNKDTPPDDFRAAMRSLAPFLVYEAARGLGVEEVTVETPLGRVAGARLSPRIVLFPILRAGLGLLEGALDVFPSARVGLVGVYRDEKTLEPVEYHLSGPKDLSDAAVFILDPMLATGGSAVFAADKVKERGAIAVRFVCVIAAPQGVEKMRARHPDVPIVAAALDPRLDENAYIVPGLGDAGDRYFGT